MSADFQIDLAFARVEVLELLAGKRELGECPGLRAVADRARHAKIELDDKGRDVWPMCNRDIEAMEKAAQSIEEHSRTFKLRRNADMRAIKRWQAATGQELTWPDHADLVVWLLERLDRLEHVGKAALKEMCALPSCSDTVDELDAALHPAGQPDPAFATTLTEVMTLRPREEWSEEDGNVLWHRVPIVELPYVGHPNSSDWPEASNMDELENNEGLPPGYYTHWQRLPPVPKSSYSKSSGGTHAD